jgi:hypothetical protein
MSDEFFHGFADEMLKVAGPIDWIKRKLGMQKKPSTTTKPPPKPKPAPPPKIMGSGQKGLKAEGVFGARR